MAESRPEQLSLGVSLKDDSTFENFHAAIGSANAQMVAALRAQLMLGGERFIYLWGGSGVGLTHLLQASCHLAETDQLRVQYLPLKELVGYAPEALLEGLDRLDLVCLDGLDAVAGKPDWELALFNLYNALREGEGRLLVAAESKLRKYGTS
ncbi:MAG TPA: DnaA/Hda family protein, partial [Cellvibrionaceae bacterium]